MALGILNGLLTIHAPLAGGSYNGKVRGQRVNANLNSNLVITLTGTAVSHRPGAFLDGDIHHHSGD